MEYRNLSNEEIATAVSLSIVLNCEEARRQFFDRFGKDAPPARTLRHWKGRFLETLSVLPKPRIGDHSARRLSEEKRDEILAEFADCPTTSQRRVSQQVGVSQSSVNKVLKEEGVKPFKFIRVQQLQNDDQPKRLQFCESVLEKQTNDQNFISKFVFSDEACFHLNGSVNSHNTFIYNRENPHATVEKLMKSAAIVCWAMVSPRIGIHFQILHSTMNGETYKEILTSTVIPIFKERRNRDLIYQQDGAPAHFSREVRNVLEREIPHRWIGRGSSFPWPPRSPDLSVLDFWLWGDIRHKLYQQPVPQNLDDLANKLTGLLANVKTDIIAKSFQSFLRRCHLCVEQSGSHFEHLL